MRFRRSAMSTDRPYMVRAGLSTGSSIGDTDARPCRGHGNTVTECPDAASALRLLRAHRQAFDVVLPTIDPQSIDDATDEMARTLLGNGRACLSSIPCEAAGSHDASATVYRASSRGALAEPGPIAGGPPSTETSAAAALQTEYRTVRALPVTRQGLVRSQDMAGELGFEPGLSNPEFRRLTAWPLASGSGILPSARVWFTERVRFDRLATFCSRIEATRRRNCRAGSRSRRSPPGPAHHR